MLMQLTVRDFALIDKITLDFDERLNVLTGETGAGKSIIIDAVSLLLGARAKSDDVRIGCEKARVEGVFTLEEPLVLAQLEELGLAEEGEEVLVLTREISAGGKNICRINNRVVTLANFKQVGQQLINIYGQHDFQAISNREQHIHLLDALGGSALRALREELNSRYEALRAANRELKNLRQTALERDERLKYLQYKLQELKELNLKPGEDDKLAAELAVLENAEQIVERTSRAYRLLYGAQASVYTQLDQAMRQLEAAVAYDDSLSEMTESLRTIIYTIEDHAMTLGHYNDRIDFDPAHKEQLDERQYALEKIKRQYNCTIEEILIQQKAIQDEIDELSNVEFELTQAQEAYRLRKAEFMETAEQLSALRHRLAREFEEQLIGQLQDLSMAQARFEVRFQTKNMERNGIDDVEFYLSANPGQPLKPLSQIASGGEMSRIMLAFKTILARHESVGTLIFDEIDTGIGGNILVKVAEKLAAVSESAQVICVTHAPQIAALADRHFLITKNVTDGNTSTSIQALDNDGQIHELARMLGGEEGYQLQHARALKAQKSGPAV